LPPLWAEKIFVGVLHRITFRSATIEKDLARERSPSLKRNPGRPTECDSFRTVLEPKTGPFEPF
jgi:hypothetical protein